MLNPFGIASTVFLVLYALLFAFLVGNFATKRFTFRSRWTLLLFHVTIRLAAQAVGLAFAVIGYRETGLLVASLVLSAEGYFSLMLCLVRLLVSWQRRYTPERHSWLAGPKNPPQLSTARRVIEGLTLVGAARSPINMIHWLLIVGNVMIITGGCLLAGGDATTVEGNWYENSGNVSTSRAVRGAGQGIFICLTLFLYGCVFAALRRASGKDASPDERRNRSVLVVLACTLPFMVTRGVFGLLQAVLNELNYYYPGIYDADGFTREFVVKEAVLATMCEWCTCALLLSTSLLGMTKRGGNAISDQEHADADDAESGTKHAAKD